MDQLDQALARDLAAYRQWHAGWGARLLDDGMPGDGDAPEPGYEITVQEGHWVLPLRRAHSRDTSRIRIPVEPRSPD